MENQLQQLTIKQSNKISLLYFNDPICSFCWAMEPKLLRFRLEYGQYFELRYIMGGLMEDWEVFSKRQGKEKTPEDLAIGWDKMGKKRGMSINGDIWLKKPVASSYPSSKAYIAMQNQGEELAVNCLRKFRELLFLENKDISELEVLKESIEQCGGDVNRFVADYNGVKTQKAFEHNLKLRKEMDVKTFPTFVFIDKKGQGYKMSGSDEYDKYVEMLTEAVGERLTPKLVNLEEQRLLQQEKYLATTEIAFALSQTQEETVKNLKNLEEKGIIKEELQKFGSFWRQYVE